MSNNQPRRVTSMRQPWPGTFKINTANRLGAKVLSAHIHGVSAITTQAGAATAGNIPTNGCEIGRGSHFDGTAYLNLNNTGVFRDETRPITIAYFSKSDASPQTYGGIARLCGIGGANAFVILRSTDTNYRLFCGTIHPTATPAFFSNASATFGGVPERVVIRCSQGFQSGTGSDYTAFINGLLLNAGSPAGFTVQTNDGNNFIGWDGVDSVFKGIVDEFVIFDGVLTAREVALYYSNPWQIFQLFSPALQALSPAVAAAGFKSRYYYDMIGQAPHV